MVQNIMAAAIGVSLLALLARLIRSRSRKNYIQCPGCQKFMQPGRRHCPFCKQELIRY